MRASGSHRQVTASKPAAYSAIQSRFAVCLKTGVVRGRPREMLRLDILAKHCANIQLPFFGACISRARRCSSISASKRLVASVPEDRLQQAQRAIEAMSNLQPQQQPEALPAAVSRKRIPVVEPLERLLMVV